MTPREIFNAAVDEARDCVVWLDAQPGATDLDTVIERIRPVFYNLDKAGLDRSLEWDDECKRKWVVRGDLNEAWTRHGQRRCLYLATIRVTELPVYLMELHIKATRHYRKPT